MQTANVFLLPDSRWHQFSPIKVKQEQLVVLIHLNVISVQICVKYACGVKPAQVRTEVFPELNITWCLCDSFRQRADPCYPYRQEISAVKRPGATIARCGRARHR